MTLVAACGGGSAGVTDPASSNVSLLHPPPETTSFFIRDLPSNTVQEPPQGVDNWSFSVRHFGADVLSVSLPQTPDTISKTGLALNNAVPLRGNGRGSFFRSFRNGFEAYIDSASSPYRAVVGGGPHTAVAYTFKSGPTVVGTTIAAEFMIPTFDATGTGVGQMSLFGYMTDGKAALAFVFLLFDNRVDDFIPDVMSDTYTSFVTQPIHARKYASPYTSAVMRKEIFTEYTPYGVTFTADNVRNIISDVNAFQRARGEPLISDDPNTYRFTLIGVLNEIALESDLNSVIKFGSSFRNFEAFHRRP